MGRKDFGKAVLTGAMIALAAVTAVTVILSIFRGEIPKMADSALHSPAEYDAGELSWTGARTVAVGAVAAGVAASRPVADRSVTEAAFVVGAAASGVIVDRVVVDRTSAVDEGNHCEGSAGTALQPEDQAAASVISLETVEWSDNSPLEEPILYFTFSNGEKVSLELECGGIIQKIEYSDITGDGTDEVLVYRYFANSATEYTLLDVFEVKDGAVKNISPEKDIPELADELWNVIVMDAVVEGYSRPVLVMEYFEKDNREVHLIYHFLVGYKDGRWQIIK